MTPMSIQCVVNGGAPEPEVSVMLGTKVKTGHFKVTKTFHHYCPVDKQFTLVSTAIQHIEINILMGTEQGAKLLTWIVFQHYHYMMAAKFVRI